MNRAERIYRLHGLLKGARPTSLKQLMAALEVSRATLNRDIEYMRLFMDAPIVFNRGAGGYHYDPDAPEFELPGLWFNDTELYALLASEQLLEAVQPGILSPQLGPLKARIRKLLEASGHDSATVTHRIRLQPFARRPLDNARFGKVAGAVLDGRPLAIEYHGRARGEATARRIHPYRLLHYRDNWYLAAWCEQKQALRLFSLDRIHHPVAGDTPLYPIDETALDRYLGASFGIFSGRAEQWAVLRFTADAARWVADEGWHPDQIGRWEGEQYELQVPYSDPRELIMEIHRYGPEVEVIAPEPLRQAVAARLAEAAARYQ